MRLSTLVELVGFVCLVKMGFLFCPEAGWGAAGGSCLIYSYLLDDSAVRASVVRVRGVWTLRRSKRAAKKG